MKVFKGKMALFGVLRENFAKFGSTYRFRTNLCTKITVFFDFENFSEILLEISRNSSKFSKIFGDLKLHTFEKLSLKNAIKHELWGYLKLHKFGGSPPKIPLVVCLRRDLRCQGRVNMPLLSKIPYLCL